MGRGCLEEKCSKFVKAAKDAVGGGGGCRHSREQSRVNSRRDVREKIWCFPTARTRKFSKQTRGRESRERERGSTGGGEGTSQGRRLRYVLQNASESHVPPPPRNHTKMLCMLEFFHLSLSLLISLFSQVSIVALLCFAPPFLRGR